MTEIFEYIIAVIALLFIITPIIWAIRNIQTGKLSKAGIFFIICALLYLFGNIFGVNKRHRESIEASKRVENILAKIELEARRLTISDFRIRLTSSIKQRKITDPFKADLPIFANAKIDSAILYFEFVDVSRDFKIDTISRFSAGYNVRIHGLAGIIGQQLKRRLYADNIVAENLEKYTYIDSLNNKYFELKIDLKKIENAIGSWNHKVDLYIKNYHFTGDLDSDGKAKILINLGM